MSDFEIKLRQLNSVGVDSIPPELSESSELYVAVLEVFCSDFESKVESIKDYYNSKDYFNLRIQVHGIKGTCYSIGAKRLGDEAKRLEFCCRTLESSDNYYGFSSSEAASIIDDELYSFIRHYKQLVEDINAIIHDNISVDISAFRGTDAEADIGIDVSNNTGTEVSSEASLISDEDFSIYMQQVKLFAEDYDLEPINHVIILLRDYNLDPHKDELVKNLKSAAEKFDYTALQSLLERY